MEPTRIFDLIEKINISYPNKPDVFSAKIAGNWTKTSIEEYERNSNYISYGLLKLGLKKGDKIATVSNNRPEWNFVDIGMAQIGVIHVPLYPTISAEEYAYILEHSEAKLLFISDKYLYAKIKPIADKVPNIQAVYTFNDVADAKSWKEVLELGKSAESAEIKNEVLSIKNSIHANDLFTIIYTSGTTGTSKGVMLTHDTFLYQIRTIQSCVDIAPPDKALSFLPICHVLERVVNYAYQYFGASIYYAESLERVAENIKEVQPQMFTTVPRLIERVYDKIIAKGRMLEGAKKQLFFWAVNLGHEYELTGKGLIYAGKLAMANSLIFSKWREALGGKIRFIISGGAALQPRLARIFYAAGMPIREGYGLTETSPIICFSHQTHPNLKFGTVGPKIGKEQELKIDEDGEILFKGPNLMLGYYKDEKLTKEVIDENGWFHTGDLGVIEDGKFLKITGRKKELFKLSTGKYITPEITENIFKESIFIEKMMVVGENQKFAGALIIPDFEFLHAWAAKKKITFRNNEELIKLPEVVERFKREINEFNKKLGSTEQVKVFTLLHQDWTPASGELSATLKKKRNVILEKYKTVIEEMYQRGKTKH